MEIRLLGTASIGGVPEWDCACHNCNKARIDMTKRRTRSSITVSLPDSKHILVDAGHDLKTQLETAKIIPVPGEGRSSKIDSVLLTHGHADHTVGLAEFCTGKSFTLPVYGPPDLIDFLFGTEERPAYFRELGRLAREYVVPRKLLHGETLKLLGIIEVEGFEVNHTRVLSNGKRYPSTTYAFEFRESDKRFIYAPDIGQLDSTFLERAKGADLLVIDACFWWDDELKRTSGIQITSYELGHVPLSDSVEILQDFDVERIIYTHFNHTNPVLDDSQPYAGYVMDAGHEIGFDGMKLIL